MSAFDSFAFSKSGLGSRARGLGFEDLGQREDDITVSSHRMYLLISSVVTRLEYVGVCLTRVFQISVGV